MSYNRSYEERGVAPTEPAYTAGTRATAPEGSGAEHLASGRSQPIATDYPRYDRRTDYDYPVNLDQAYDPRHTSQYPGVPNDSNDTRGTTNTRHVGFEAPGTNFGPVGSDHMRESTIPPAAGSQNHHQTARGGTGQKMAGKLESAIGTLVSSETLKAEGRQKQREGNAMNIQGRELAEAERLEQEATHRRRRAVAQGAHPDNLQVGGGGNARDRYP